MRAIHELLRNRNLIILQGGVIARPEPDLQPAWVTKVDAPRRRKVKKKGK